MGIESDEENSRNLRVKERKHYTEDCLQDEEIEGRRMFSVEEKLTCERFESCFVDEMKGEDFNLKYLQEHGFTKPVLFKDKAGLGMRMPSANFTVNDVRQCVGSRRVLDVMDVTTQKDIEMTMKDWCRYFENQNRDQLLNVISLEFSHTRLENYVESPTVVRQVDWVDWVWPRHLKDSQTEGTNSLDEMKYPKVQKYCLMSVKGCYTDFHIDFGGTSVWYHILRGKKVFWLIPPTERNLALYENWVLSGKQGDVFFGDTVEKCARVQLESGDTFFIPTGWIHAVHTPEDTLVFGGNFLHNFGIEKQLRIAEVEDVTHVPVKFRYPFYTEILWYVVQRFVHCLLGKNYLIVNESGDYLDPANENAADALNLTSSTEKDPKLLSLTHNPVHMTSDNFAFPFKGIGDNFHQEVSNGKIEQSTTTTPEVSSEVKNVQVLDFSSSTVDQKNVPKEHIHITKWEYNGLKAILKWLNGLPVAKKAVPSYIRDPDGLLEDLKVLLKEHELDDPRLAITGKPSLYWFDIKKPKPKPRTAPVQTGGSKGGKSGNSKGNNSSNARRRRTRCKKCEACLRADCGECHFCKDMKKFGGPGRMKQSCISRQCMAPVLPHTACCMICGRDGWDKLTNPPENENSSLMECSQCWEILHPKCLQEKNPDLPMESCINDDLPNSWECPKCCRNGKPDQIKPRQLKGKSPKGIDVTRMMIHSNESGLLDMSTSEMQEKLDVSQIKVEMPQNISHSEMPDITKRIYDMEQPLDLGPLKKKVKVENIPTIQSSVESNNNAELEDMRNCLAVSNTANSLQTCNPKYAVSLCEKEEDSCNRSPTSPNKEMYECNKKPTITPPHIRSCARYPLHIKKAIKTEQGKVLRVKNINENLKSKFPLGVVRKHGETARERLFRNLKGLKKNLLIKKNFGKCDEANNTKPLSKEFKVVQTCGNVKIKQEVYSGVVEDGKHDLMAVSPEKLIKTENGETNAQNPKISSMLTNSPHLKKPKYVVRPAPVVEDNTEEKIRNSIGKTENLAIEKEVMLPVFQFLSVRDLYTCQLVCKTWNRWSVDPRLWTLMDLTRKKITASTLIGIVRRQPVILNLSWTNLSRRQLAWLIARLPQMKELILSGCSSASVLALCTCNCPLLRSLDLSWVEGLNDSVIRDLLSAPPDSRPGFIESKTRLRHLNEVKLAGADISDVSVRLLAHHLPLLSKLDLSHCHKVTDMGIAVLGAAKSARLQSLDVSSCSNITDTSLEALRRCANLSHLDLRDCGQVTEAACLKFVGQSRQTLIQKEAKFIKRHV